MTPGISPGLVDVQTIKSCLEVRPPRPPRASVDHEAQTPTPGRHGRCGRARRGLQRLVAMTGAAAEISSRRYAG